MLADYGCRSSAIMGQMLERAVITANSGVPISKGLRLDRCADRIAPRGRDDSAPFFLRLSVSATPYRRIYHMRAELVPTLELLCAKSAGPPRSVSAASRAAAISFSRIHRAELLRTLRAPSPPSDSLIVRIHAHIDWRAFVRLPHEEDHPLAQSAQPAIPRVIT